MSDKSNYGVPPGHPFCYANTEPILTSEHEICIKCNWNISIEKIKFHININGRLETIDGLDPEEVDEVINMFCDIRNSELYNEVDELRQMRTRSEWLLLNALFHEIYKILSPSFNHEQILEIIRCEQDWYLDQENFDAICFWCEEESGIDELDFIKIPSLETQNYCPVCKVKPDNLDSKDGASLCTECGHSICGDCTFILTKKNNKKCPICRTLVTNDKEQNIEKLTNLINTNPNRHNIYDIKRTLCEIKNN